MLQLVFSPLEKSAVSGWAAWAESFAGYFLRCIQNWADACKAASERGQEDLAALTALDAVPGIRLLLDSNFIHCLRQVQEPEL